MTTLRIQIADVEMGDDDDKFVEVPAHWVICSTCRGNGKHSLRFGAITQSDIDRDWDPDSFDDYLSGAYDEACDPCNGTGKVLVINHDAPMNAAQKAAIAHQTRMDDIDDEIDAMHRAEIAFGC